LIWPLRPGAGIVGAAANRPVFSSSSAGSTCSCSSRHLGSRGGRTRQAPQRGPWVLALNRAWHHPALSRSHEEVVHGTVPMGVENGWRVMQCTTVPSPGRKRRLMARPRWSEQRCWEAAFLSSFPPMQRLGVEDIHAGFGIGLAALDRLLPGWPPTAPRASGCAPCDEVRSSVAHSTTAHGTCGPLPRWRSAACLDEGRSHSAGAILGHRLKQPAALRLDQQLHWRRARMALPGRCPGSTRTGIPPIADVASHFDDLVGVIVRRHRAGRTPSCLPDPEMPKA